MLGITYLDDEALPPDDEAGLDDFWHLDEDTSAGGEEEEERDKAGASADTADAPSAHLTSSSLTGDPSDAQGLALDQLDLGDSYSAVDGLGAAVVEKDIEAGLMGL